MLPYSDHSYSTRPQQAAVSPVSLFVATKLGSPKLASGFWGVTTQGASVPEASVDENGDLSGVKEKIWLAKVIGGMEAPASNPIANEGHAQNLLCTLIAFAFYTPHNMRARRINF